MSEVQRSPIYDDLLDFLVEKATPQEILEYRPAAAAQQRADDLIERSSEGTLTPEDRAELEQMMQVDRLVSVLKIRSLARLNRL